MTELDAATLAPRATERRMPRTAFRPDIEGLRAVAVDRRRPVSRGHTGYAGGYIGVDVFFVISGFLITGLLWREVPDHEHRCAGPFLRCPRPALAAGRGHRRPS